MFYYLDGTVAEILPGLAVIDCGGVGYCIFPITPLPAEREEEALHSERGRHL